jgi:hypothetical protein
MLLLEEGHSPSFKSYDGRYGVEDGLYCVCVCFDDETQGVKIGAKGGIGYSRPRLTLAGNTRKRGGGEQGMLIGSGCV